MCVWRACGAGGGGGGGEGRLATDNPLELSTLWPPCFTNLALEMNIIDAFFAYQIWRKNVEIQMYVRNVFSLL